MTPLVLHSFRRCPYAIRVRLTLEEKNLQYTVVEEDLKAKSAELLKLHPEGRVPLLIHNGFVIYESSVITEYLEDAFPSPQLRPTEARKIAEMRLWTYWCNTSFRSVVHAYKYEWTQLNEEKQHSLQGSIQHHLDKLEAALSERPFLITSKLTLTDIHVVPFVRQLSKAQSDFRERFSCPKTLDWLTSIENRESFTRAMKKAE
jgi:glutathione S-transferase